MPDPWENPIRDGTAEIWFRTLLDFHLTINSAQALAAGLSWEWIILTSFDLPSPAPLPKKDAKCSSWLFPFWNLFMSRPTEITNRVWYFTQADSVKYFIWSSSTEKHLQYVGAGWGAGEEPGMHHFSSESYQQKVCQHRLPFQGNPSQWNLFWGRRKLSLGSADPRSNTSSRSQGEWPPWYAVSLFEYVLSL